MRLYFFESAKLEAVRVWVDQSGHVILIDADLPPAKPEQYFKVLGKPDAELDYPWGRIVVKGGEHVWLARGVTLASTEKGSIHVGIFRADVSLDEYERLIRYTAEADEDEG